MLAEGGCGDLVGHATGDKHEKQKSRRSEYNIVMALVMASLAFGFHHRMLHGDHGKRGSEDSLIHQGVATLVAWFSLLYSFGMGSA